MSNDISQPIPEEIYYAAEQYLPRLPDELQAQILALLARAHSGQKCDNAILSLMSDDQDARRWMRQALFGDQFGTLKGGYDPLAGTPTSIPSNSRWDCPQCGFEWRVLRAGRPVPPCPNDYSVLVRMKE
jgi:hypothetical protein